MPYQQYSGEVVTVNVEKQFGFIGLLTVRLSNDQEHDLVTSEDIFVHQNDVDTTLIPGLRVAFDVELDDKRGDGTFRAVNVIALVEHDLLPAMVEPIPGFHVVVPAGQSFKLTAYHAQMKDVRPEVVAQVEANQPLPGIPREDIRLDNEETRKFLQAFLLYTFPSLVDYGADFNIGTPDDTAMQLTLQEAIESHRALGLTSQVEVLEEEVKRFGKFRGALNLLWADGVARPGSIIPIENLPDLFMAVPVWYHYFANDTQGKSEAVEAANTDDPWVHARTAFFCDLVPTRRWSDLYQMFNRRLRTLENYKGDIIPPHVARRLQNAAEVFDYLVIATPYLEEAGKDWENLDWIRSIDPYVLGFIKDSPVFFVVARFSNSGTFPLYNELLGDTVEFLRSNRSKLDGFNTVSRPFWYRGGDTGVNDGNPLRDCFDGLLGQHLSKLTEELLRQFDQGTLFPWIRQEEEQPTKQ
ncbi:MAG: hypothetical protein WCV85_06025 [Patescibacteria group bacterium]|jgi:cold shock CspA family protein